MVDPVRSARALNNIVYTFASSQLANFLDYVFVAHVNDMVSAKLLANFKTVITCPSQNNGLRPHGFGNRSAHQTNGPRARYNDAFAGDKTAKFSQSVHRSASSNHQRCLFVRHRVSYMNKRVDVVNSVFCKATICSKAVCTMTFVNVAVVFAIVVAGRVHPCAAALTLTTARMNFYGHAFTNLIVIHTGAQGHNSAHVLVSRRKVLVEGIAAVNLSRRTMINDFQVSSTNGNCINPNENFRLFRHRHIFFFERYFARASKDPSIHFFWDRVV